MNVIIKSPEPVTGRPTPTKGTKVFLEDGSQVKGITGITVTFAMNDIVRATIDLFASPETIHASAILSLESVKWAASHYGFELHPKDGTSD